MRSVALLVGWLAVSWALKQLSRPPAQLTSHRASSDGSPDPTSLVSAKIPPSSEDMRVFAKILANLTDHIDSQPDVALTM